VQLAPGLAVSGRLVREYTDDDVKEEEQQKSAAQEIGATSPAMHSMRGASLLPLAIRLPNKSAAESEQEKTMAYDRAMRIAALNDKFCKGMAGG
jgi:hypothetical protein